MIKKLLVFVFVVVFIINLIVFFMRDVGLCFLRFFNFGNV